MKINFNQIIRDFTGEAVKRGNGDISLYFIVEEWDGII